MDIHGIVDLFNVAVTVMVAFKVRSLESVLLATFFAVSSVISFFLFQTEMYVIWPYVFTFLCVMFGIASLSTPSVFGYILFLILIALNEAEIINYYSQAICLVYYWQLWMAYHANGNDTGRRSRSHYSHHKAIKS